MAKYKYRLSYINGVTKKAIDLSKLECLNNLDVTELENIDNFIASFKSKDELLNFLRENELIDEKVRNVFITREIKDKIVKGGVYQERIYYGECLFYKDDYSFLNKKQIKYFIRTNAEEGRIIRIIAENYLKKYQNGPNNIRGVLETLKKLASTIESKGMSSISYSDEVEYNKCIESFISFEFNKYDYNTFTREFIRKRTTDGKSINNYNSIRRFAIFVINNPELKEKFMKGVENKIIPKLDVYDNESVFKKEVKFKDINTTEDHEEFLTEEDFEKVNHNILETYDDSESIYEEDGHEHIRPLTKEELKDSLEELAENFIIENDGIRLAKKMR